MEITELKGTQFPMSPLFAVRSRECVLNQTLEALTRELGRCMITLCSKQHYTRPLPENFEYYTFLPDYEGSDFTNHAILPSYVVQLMDVFPEIKDLLFYHAYEISADFPKGFPTPHRPSRYWLINFDILECHDGLPQRVLEEINKLTTRIPKWFEHTEQINSKILMAYLSLEKLQNGKVYSDEIEKESGLDPKTFADNFNQMDRIAEKNHGKVFQTENENGRERVYLWCYAEKIIREIEDPSETEDCPHV